MDIDGTSSDFWELVEVFYKSLAEFRRLFEGYEQKVAEYAQDRKVDRRKLKLSAEEVSGLFDFRALERLRNDFLVPLKIKAHKLFRTLDHTDTFDRSVSEIFHEVSILKEEHYTVKTYGPLENQEISAMILEEVHRYFPIRLSKINHLFNRARARLEALFPQNAQNRIFIRSLYIFGESLLADTYSTGLRAVYEHIYPEGGPVEGYFHAGKSFYDSGFWDLAQEALEKSRDAASSDPSDHQARLEEVEGLLKKVRLNKS